MKRKSKACFVHHRNLEIIKILKPLKVSIKIVLGMMLVRIIMFE